MESRACILGSNSGGGAFDTAVLHDYNSLIIKGIWQEKEKIMGNLAA